MSDRFLQEIMQWDREFRKLLEAWLAKVGVEPYSASVATEPVATAPVATEPVATAPVATEPVATVPFYCARFYCARCYCISRQPRLRAVRRE